MENKIIKGRINKNENKMKETTQVILENIGALPLLVICSWTDIKKKEILLKIPAITVLFAVIYWIYQVVYGNEDILSLAQTVFMAEIPGLLMLLLAWLGGGRVGIGDGILLLTLGTFLRPRSLWFVFFLSLWAAGIAGLVLWIGFHKGRNYAMPFVPFLLGAYVVVDLCSIVTCF